MWYIMTLEIKLDKTYTNVGILCTICDMFSIDNMIKIYSIELNKRRFYMVDNGQPISLVYHTILDARTDKNSFAIAMPTNKEVISSGNSLGFYKNSKQLSQDIVDGKKIKKRVSVPDDTSEAERLTCR